SADWNVISAEYVRVRMAPPLGGEGYPGGVARAAVGADGQLAAGEVLQEIIANVSGRGNAWTDALLPLLVDRYLGVSVRVLGVDGEVRGVDGQVPSDGGGDAVTLALVPGQAPGVAGDVWAGLAPLRAPQVMGAGTRPADVAGGWTESGPVVDFIGASGA